MLIKNVVLLVFAAFLSLNVDAAQAKSIPEKRDSELSYKLPNNEYIKKEHGKIKFYSIPLLSKETLQILTAAGIGAMAVTGLGMYNIASSRFDNDYNNFLSDEISLLLLSALGAVGFASSVIGGVVLYNFDYYEKPVLEFDKNGLNCNGSWFAWKNVSSVKMKNKQEIIGYGRHQQVHRFDYIAIRLRNGALHEIRHSGIAIKLTELLELINFSWEKAQQKLEEVS
ncbi:hypothetical protein JST56_04340 [Candidatus Dependentiae bacterium]|nr:hypothetical protein [Candidatus Dependentiae bacterium]